MREIVDVEPSSRNEEAQTEYKMEEQALLNWAHTRITTITLSY